MAQTPTVLHDADSANSGTPPIPSDPTNGTYYIEEGVDPNSNYFLNGGASDDTVQFGKGTTHYTSGGGALTGDFSNSHSGVNVDGFHAQNGLNGGVNDMNADFTPNSMHTVIGSDFGDHINLGNGAGVAYDVTGGLGGDILTAGNGGGVNTFHYNNFMDSTAAPGHTDTINNFHNGVDAIDLHNANLAGFGAGPVTGTLDPTNFANQAAIDGQAAGTIGVFHANNNTFLVDHLGAAGDATHDLVIGVHDMHTLADLHVHV